MSALTVSSVSKQFFQNHTPFIAVDHVDLKIEAGSIHGLLGPNGAGKSTLINMMSGVMLPSEGSIQIFGKDIVKDTETAKQLLGVVPQEIVVEMAFTVEEVLYYFAGMYGVPVRERSERIGEVLKDLSLEEKRNDRARNLSGGMKRRLMIAKAILHRPKLLVLDEPTAGVDVALRQKIWELVRRLNQEGTAILFTTHYLEEAEQLCDKITLINHGKIIREGSLKELQTGFSKKNAVYFELFRRDVPMIEGVRPVGTEYEFVVGDLAKDVEKLTRHYGENLKSIRTEHASLEQIFLELTA